MRVVDEARLQWEAVARVNQARAQSRAREPGPGDALTCLSAARRERGAATGTIGSPNNNAYYQILVGNARRQPARASARF